MKFLLGVFLSIFLPLTILYGQVDQLYSFLSPQSTLLGKEAKQLYNELGKPENNPNIKESYIVAFDAFEKKETIHFSLNVPGNNSTLYLESNTYFREETELEGLSLVFDVWGGSISGPRQTGSFMLVRSGQRLVSGFLQFNGTYYAFQPIDFGVSLLQETKVVNPHLTCGTNSPVESGFNSISQSTSPFCDPPPPEFQCRKQWVILDCWSQGLVDSLYEKYSAYSHPFYNLDAYYVSLDKIWGRVRFLQLLANNNITGINITWEGHNIDYPNLYSGNISTDRATFEQQSNQLKPIYNHHRAILSTHHTYGTTYGVAEVPVSSSGYNSNLDDAALTVHWEVGYPWYAYAHELGHLMGGRHDDDPDPICSKGYKFSNNNVPDRTIMHTLDTAEAQLGRGSILYFSNPSQTYNGSVLGTSSKNNKIVVHNVLCDNLGQAPVAVSVNGINTTHQSGSDYLYSFPNPFKNNFIINSSQPILEYQLYNSNGKLLLFDFFKSEITKKEINTTNLLEGVYLLRVKNVDKTFQLKLIKI